MVVAPRKSKTLASSDCQIQWFDTTMPAQRPSPADDYLRNYYLDLGLNPRNANEALVDPSGQSIVGARSVNWMAEGRRLGGPGTRTLYDNNELNNAVSLNTGSGSPQDYPGGGTHNYVGAGYKPLVGAMSPQQRLMSGYGSPDEVAAYRARRNEIETTNEHLGQQDVANKFTREQQMRSRLPVDMLGVFDQLTPMEKNDIVMAPPESQRARLASHPLRGLKPKYAGATGYIGLNSNPDYLTDGVSSDGDYLPPITSVVAGAGGGRPAATIRSVGTRASNSFTASPFRQTYDPRLPLSPRLTLGHR